MIETSKHTPLLNFLIEPRFRIWRHMLLVLVLLVISFNQMFLVFADSTKALGYNIYWICSLLSIPYLAVAYLNIYILIPKLLLNKRYGTYILLFSLTVLSLPFILLTLEYFIRNAFDLPHRVVSYINFWIIVSRLSNFMLIITCFLGTSITVLLKHWMKESQYVSRLEKEHIQSEVDQLKEQITPDFLFKILNHTSVLVKTNPTKASNMLMRLGQLLRYQLYDCSRNKVLLSSEINFLTNYLDLEQLYKNKFEYKIATTSQVNSIFVSPLLFIPFVQNIVNKINSVDESVFLSISFEVEEQTLYFSCRLDNSDILLNDDFVSVRQRIKHLYDENYNLVITQGTIKLQLNLSEL